MSVHMQSPDLLVVRGSDAAQIVSEEESHGWSFVNEGTALKKKTGYVADAVGSRLVG